MSPDGADLINITNHAAADSDADWSPDGSTIAFYSTRSGNGDVWIMNADGAGPVNLTNHTRRDGNDEVYVMNAGGSNPTNVTNHPVRLTTHPADDEFPAWRP
ncbi:MAG: TolB family protein [Gemmatimonadales bacterium]